MLDLTKAEAHALAYYIDKALIRSIRSDTIHFNKMLWLKYTVRAYEKLCAYSDYPNCVIELQGGEEETK